MPGRPIDLYPKRDIEYDHEELVTWMNSFQLTLNGKPFYRDTEDLSNLTEYYYISPADKGVRRFAKNEEVAQGMNVEQSANFLYEKACRGELFVRAYGEEYPRRITVEKNGLCGVSQDPVSGLNLVDQVEDPGFWVKLLHTVTGGLLFSKTMDEYNRQMQQKELAPGFNGAMQYMAKHYNKNQKEEEERYLESLQDLEKQDIQKRVDKQEKERQAHRDREEGYLRKNPEDARLLDQMGDQKNAYLDVCREMNFINNLSNNIDRYLGVERKDNQKIIRGQAQEPQKEGTKEFGYYSDAARYAMTASGMKKSDLAVLAMMACCTPAASDARREQVAQGYLEIGKEFHDKKQIAMGKDLRSALDGCHHRLHFRQLIDDIFFQREQLKDAMYRSSQVKTAANLSATEIAEYVKNVDDRNNPICADNKQIMKDWNRRRKEKEGHHDTKAHSNQKTNGHQEKKPKQETITMV